MNYRQPEFYRFSRDSIILAEIVSQEIKSLSKVAHVLDVGCGCGVIGLEIARRLGPGLLGSLTLLEKNEKFMKSIQENVEQFLTHKLYCQVVHQDLFDFSPVRNYTHLVCNPPYFLEGRGRPSPDLQKRSCRSWRGDEAQEFMLKLYSMGQEERAKVYISGRQELETLLHQQQISYRVIQRYGPTFFYVLL